MEGMPQGFKRLGNEYPLKVGDYTRINRYLLRYLLNEIDQHHPRTAALIQDLAREPADSLWVVTETPQTGCGCPTHGCEGNVRLRNVETGMETPAKCWGFGYGGYLFIRVDSREYKEKMEGLGIGKFRKNILRKKPPTRPA